MITSNALIITSQKGGSGGTGTGAALVTSVTITAAQLKSMETAPITVIPAPGVGKMIALVSPIMYVYKPNTTGYVLNNANWGLFYDFSSFLPSWVIAAAQAPQAAHAGINPTNIGITGLNLTSQSNTTVVPTTNLTALLENKALTLYNIGNTSSAWQSSVPLGQPILTVALPGSGFAVNDVFTLPGINAGTARFTVNSVNAAGGILTFTQVTGAANSNSNAEFFARGFQKVTIATGSGINGYVNIAVGAMGGNGITVSTLGNSGGTGYVNGDTGTIAFNSGTGINAKYTVLTTSAGAVVTYSITDVGAGFFTASNLTTTHTTGVGTGFTITVTGTGGGYAAGDTGTISGGTYTINTVDGSGNVLTYTLGGTPASVQGAAVLGVKGGGQPGIGNGFYLFPTAISNDVTTGDGTIEIIATYTILTI